jgi:hypothetical protein
LTFPSPLVYIVALALTLVVEMPVYALGLAAVGNVRWPSGGATGLRVNLVSHPLAFLVAFPLLAPRVGTLPTLVAVEIGVVYLEAGLVWRRGRTGALGALAASCVANVGSLAIGLAILR